MTVLLALWLLSVAVLSAHGQNCDNIGTLLNCGYNHTVYGSPNYTANPNIDSISSATFYLPQLSEVIELGCSTQTIRFGCATLFPRCTTGLGPCRSLCHRMNTDCAADLLEQLQAASLVLAPLLRCDKYPTDNNCVDILEVSVTPPAVSPSSTAAPSRTNTRPTPTSLPGNTTTGNLTDTGCPPPRNNYFTDSAKTFAVGWTATWSILSFLSTLLTILTFLLKPSRFQYPWRPIVYLAVCFNVHSIGYIFGLILGRNIVTCPGNQFITTTIAWQWNHVPCLLVFGLLYYSMMAAFLWWLVLTLAWCLTSLLKWSNEAIGNLAPFFHVVSWILPLLLVIGLIAGRVVSADELTGVCFVVRDDSQDSFYGLLLGVIVPLMVFLVLGTVFLSVGLISVCRIHAFLRNKGQEKESIVLEKLMIRVGVFVSIYILPAAVMIGCFFYELLQRPKWKTIEELENCSSDCHEANPTVLIVRVFMFLVIGVLTGVWIWSKKTLHSWKDLVTNIRNCCSSQMEDSPEPTGYSMTTVKY